MFGIFTRPRPPKPLRGTVRIRFIGGEHSGQYGYCMEGDRFETGEYGPGRHVPVDIDGWTHVHVPYEDIEVMR